MLSILAKKDIHLVLYIILSVLCLISSLMWQSLKACRWNVLYITTLELHAAPAFVVIYLTLVFLHFINKSSSLSVCICFDIIGFSLHLISAMLQLWAYFAQEDILAYYLKTGGKDVLIVGERKTSCKVNWSFLINIIIAIIILIDMLLFLITDGGLEEASKRPHNLGDNMLDAFQDAHFWVKLIGFILMLVSSLSLIREPHQCTNNAFWFSLIVTYSTPAFSLIFLGLIFIYVFGEYPNAFFCTVLDIIGVIIIGYISFVQLYISFLNAHSPKGGSCYFNSSAIVNCIIITILIVDVAVYISVEFAMGIEQRERRYNGNGTD